MDENKNSSPENGHQDRGGALLSRLIRQMVKSATPDFLQDCEFRPVQTKEEFVACSRVVHTQYVDRDYMNPHKNRLRLDLHQITQKSTTFIALYKKRYILATLTLVGDSAMGVPMDKIYKEELDDVRKKKRSFAEVSMLAVNEQLLPELGFKKSDQMILLVNLFREMLSFGRFVLGADSLVACFHPRHELFYQALQFHPVAGLKSYESVQGSPALAYMLDVSLLDQKAEGDVRIFFGLDKPRKHQSDKSFYHFKFDEFFEIFTNIDSAA